MAKKITAELTISLPKVTSWQPLENLAKDYQTLYLSKSVSISCPQTIVGRQEFLYVVD
jgi:hypothetical protein